jgi:hypothetical protein
VHWALGECLGHVAGFGKSGGEEFAGWVKITGHEPGGGDFKVCKLGFFRRMSESLFGAISWKPITSFFPIAA